MNPLKQLREKAFTMIRERYIELRRTGTPWWDAVENIASDPSINILEYTPNYVRDICHRIDPQRGERKTPKKNTGISRTHA